jgi:O-antigen/teichoic acid export membrane protein
MFANASWTFIGNGLYSASQWLMIVVLARLTNPDAVGTLALATAITAPVMLLSNMQLRAVASTDVRTNYRLADYIYTRFLTTAVASAGIIIFALPFGKSAATVLVIVLITLSKAAESMSDILYGHWQLIEHMEVVGKSLLIRGGLTVAAFATSIALTRSLVWGAGALLAGSLGVLLIYDARRLRHYASMAPAGSAGRDFRAGSVVSLIRLSAPLGLVAMLISLNSSIPRYFIEAYRGKHDLGIFSALSYFVLAGNLVISAIGQSALPRLAKLYHLPQRSQFRKLLAGLFAVSGLLSVASLVTGVLFGRRLLSIYGAEYAGSYNVFIIIMGVASTGYFIFVLNYALNAIGAYKVQVPLFSAVTALLIILCRITIPRYGIGGAAVSMLAVGLVQTAASGVLLGLRTRDRKHSHDVYLSELSSCR